jgi:DNA-binding transcriptional MerR regulator
MTAKNSKYYQGWYADNGEDLNDRRRKRYKNDPEYRAKVQEWNRRAREKRKEDRDREKKARRRAVKMTSTGAWKTVEIEVDGVKRRMFTIGALAKALGKGVSTIRVWERMGVLPETPYRSGKGDRLYSVEMVEEIQQQLRRGGKLDASKLKLRKKPTHVVREVRYSDGEVEKVQLFKIGSLARAVSRTVVALTQMEKRGVLPRTPLLASSLNYRLYTVEMIEAVQKAFEKRGGQVRGRSEWEDFHNEIEDEWTELRLMEARLV